ncbi:UNVERIFIED_CONTAM: hypothetical protein HDU68_010124, partial [Siphonaria sp. JEL0065]
MILKLSMLQRVLRLAGTGCHRAVGTNGVSNSLNVIGAKNPIRKLSSKHCPMHPPIAKREQTIHAHGPGTPDLYHWMKDQTKGTKRKEILEYLEAENDWAKHIHLTPNAALSETLYNEFLSKIQETDQDVPYLKAPYWYYTKTIEGQQYSIYCRKRESFD